MPTASDAILDILGNDTRRRILGILARQPMYFNQLAKEIAVGQQAMLRHMQALEESGLVETYAEKSKFGAPERKYYKLNSSFTLIISLSEDDFTIKNQDITESRLKESRKYYKMHDSTPKNTTEALAILQENLAQTDEEISTLESRLIDMRALRQRILRRLHEIGTDNFEEQERKVLYTIVMESPESVKELSTMMDEKESQLRGLIRGMRNKMGLDIFDDLLD